MSLFYVVAGINHFRKPDFYKPLMPPYIPWHSFMIVASGVAEIGLGLFLLLQPTRPWAAWGIITMLIAFMPVHIYMYQERHTIFLNVPAWIIVARIPLQAVLIAWAYLYTI
jgi:uncharacterized membrane protein